MLQSAVHEAALINPGCQHAPPRQFTATLAAQDPNSLRPQHRTTVQAMAAGQATWVVVDTRAKQSAANHSVPSAGHLACHTCASVHVVPTHNMPCCSKAHIIWLPQCPYQTAMQPVENIYTKQAVNSAISEQRSQHAGALRLLYMPPVAHDIQQNRTWLLPACATRKGCTTMQRCNKNTCTQAGDATPHMYTHASDTASGYRWQPAGIFCCKTDSTSLPRWLQKLIYCTSLIQLPGG